MFCVTKANLQREFLGLSLDSIHNSIWHSSLPLGGTEETGKEVQAEMMDKRHELSSSSSGGSVVTVKNTGTHSPLGHPSVSRSIASDKNTNWLFKATRTGRSEFLTRFTFRTRVRDFSISDVYSPCLWVHLPMMTTEERPFYCLQRFIKNSISN